MRTPQAEQDLVDAARVLAGDTAAFDGIVERWQVRIVNLAWRYTRNRSSAEDIAQEVFLKVFRSLSSFRKESAFSTWIVAIALNTCRSRLHSDGPPPILLDPERAAAGRTPHEHLQEHEHFELIQRAVLALPDRYRDAIVLFYFEEKDLAETARVLGISEGTLKSQLHRGRDLLRQKLEALWGNK